MKKIGNKNYADPVPCKWCARSMPPVAEYVRGVCVDCYRLLKGAGVSDEEIFAEIGEQRTGSI